MPEIGIVAALEREVWPLIRNWPVRTVRWGGSRYKFYQGAHAVLVCGGIGGSAARRAAQALVELRQPDTLLSAGFAGALEPELRAGSTLAAARIVDAETGESFESGQGNGTLLSTARVLSAAEKAELRGRYGAIAVDMEAGAVAAVAKERRMPFVAIKAICDDTGLSLPPFTSFIDEQGRFLTAAYVGYVAPRPWLWPLVFRMGRSSARAASALSQQLREFLSERAVGPAEFTPETQRAQR
jgi:adenosylhomocysteine nucleosidase